jgi:hypothetical protein
MKKLKEIRDSSDNRRRQKRYLLLINIQLLHLNEINMRFYGAEYNNIERGEAEFNIVVLCSIKPHIDQVQV